MLYCFLVLFLCTLASSQLQEITNLPSSPSVSFKQYSGYYTVDQKSNRNLFGWFTESQNDPATDPLVIWLTGGPGCSSLLAFLGENGPFRPTKDHGDLVMNPYSWNKVANVLWLESPAGVGFSYSDNPKDYTTGDVRTANDSYVWLQGFLAQFPQYANAPFWITGESYGGHYVPELAQRVAQGNDRKEGVHINLKGHLVGNAWTDIFLDNTGSINSWKHRGIVSIDAVDAIEKNCNLSWTGPLKSKRDVCDAAVNRAMDQMGNINIYDIYVDVCLHQGDSPQLKQLAKYSNIHRALLTEEPHHKKREVDVCINDYLVTYLNRADVQKAIHAKPMPWSECSNKVNYSHLDLATSVIPIYRWLIDRGDLHILVYSGDVDAIVAYEGTSYWMPKLGLSVTKPWRQWLDAAGQVGGYFTQYAQQFAFSTVRNAGHEVPFYQPQRAYQMFSEFIANQTIQTN